MAMEAIGYETKLNIEYEINCALTASVSFGITPSKYGVHFKLNENFKC